MAESPDVLDVAVAAADRAGNASAEPPRAPRSTPRRTAFLFGGPLLGLAVFAAVLAAGPSAAAAGTAGITAWCAVWWIGEPIPLPATSLLPFALLPLLGIVDHQTIAHAYGHHLILLLLGGFVLSKAVERSGAHRRIALAMVRGFGHGGRRGLVLGFMTATAFCSMWISNTAAVLMMLPVVAAVLAADDREDLGPALLLGIAYAASIGGLGTPVGTPPNMTFMAVYETTGHPAVSFLEWMTFGIPVVILLVPLAWLVVVRGVAAGAAPVVPDEGPWRPAEKKVALVFAATATAWVTRDIPGVGGWAEWCGITSAGDETVALAAVLVLFLLRGDDGGPLLDWPSVESLPWGILLLFAGGLAIATAFEASGLSLAIGELLGGLAGLSPLLVVGGLCLGVTFLTEVTSNTATAALLMPILAAAAVPAGLDPRVLMVPAAMSASCAFMLPVATAPNAIVFGTGRLPIRTMARRGFGLNLVGALAITAATLALIR